MDPVADKIFDLDSTCISLEVAIAPAPVSLYVADGLDVTLWGSLLRVQYVSHFPTCLNNSIVVLVSLISLTNLCVSQVLYNRQLCTSQVNITLFIRRLLYVFQTFTRCCIPKKVNYWLLYRYNIFYISTMFDMLNYVSNFILYPI